MGVLVSGTPSTSVTLCDTGGLEHVHYRHEGTGINMKRDHQVPMAVPGFLLLIESGQSTGTS